MSKATMAIARQCVPIFATLQDGSRQQILGQLFENGEMSVTALAEKMDISRPAVSHHLKQLLLAGLVAARKEGKERLYRLSLEDSLQLIRALLEALERDCEELARRG